VTCSSALCTAPNWFQYSHLLFIIYSIPKFKYQVYHDHLFCQINLLHSREN
jgi:hypothetical protein